MEWRKRLDSGFFTFLMTASRSTKMSTETGDFNPFQRRFAVYYLHYIYFVQTS